MVAALKRSRSYAIGVQWRLAIVFLGSFSRFPTLFALDMSVMRKKHGGLMSCRGEDAEYTDGYGQHGWLCNTSLYDWVGISLLYSLLNAVGDFPVGEDLRRLSCMTLGKFPRINVVDPQMNNARYQNIKALCIIRLTGDAFKS
jgi:hypothetical protein